MANPTVQKIIGVSDVAQLEKIRQETSALPENFRKALGFFQQFVGHAFDYHTIMENLITDSTAQS